MASRKAFAHVRGTTAPYSAYVDELTSLARDVARGAWHRIEEDVSLALNGQAADRLRQLVSVEARRSHGAFFTSGTVRASFSKALRDSMPSRATRFWDPTCGAGDLLLAASDHLPVGESVDETLGIWTRSLRGSDLQPEFVAATRLRLYLAAAYRTHLAGNGGQSKESHRRGPAALRSIRVEDGLAALQATRSFHGNVLLNPPFGAMTAEKHWRWASGSVSQAAVFTLAASRSLAVGAKLTAVLPDVLRSGSRYERWRDHITECLTLQAVQTHGQFDSYTDIHVFLLSGTRHRRSDAMRHVESVWWTTEQSSECLGDLFEVRIGPVVDNRDPHEGPEAPFLKARALPPTGDMGIPRQTRRFAGRLAEPPFVAIRRTSRPGQGTGGQGRGVGVLLTGHDPVAVDNHIITARPLDGQEETCRNLLKVLASPSVATWLDERIRCRHLTVRAVREIPWSLA